MCQTLLGLLYACARSLAVVSHPVVWFCGDFGAGIAASNFLWPRGSSVLTSASAIT